jgi:hypothetical protein
MNGGKLGCRPLQEKYTPKLGLADPSEVVISDADGLLSYWSRLLNGWASCGSKFENMKNVYEHVQNWWDEQIKNKSDPNARRFEKMFPGGLATTEEAITEMQRRMGNAAVELRNSLVDFLPSLSFSFKREK